MADILISRQNYALEGETPAEQYNGWMPNTITGALTGTSVGANAEAEIPADFKDHKTVFIINAQAGGNLTLFAGDSYQGVKNVTKPFPAGMSVLNLMDSAKFIDQKTGKIKIKPSAAITIVGYEMR